MKKHLTLVFALITYVSFSQPINDDCSGIIALGVAPVCVDTDIYSNVDATASNIGNDNIPNCFSAVPERDVWFSFTAADTLLEYTISVFGCPDPGSGAASITNPEIGIYRGDICAVDELVLLDCATSQAGQNDVELKPPTLTPGITYYLRINDWSSSGSPNWGAFKVCVEESMPIFTIDQGGSTDCSGEIFDTGGEFGNYSSNENHVFTICPDQPHGCINFTLAFYNIESVNLIDKLIIYDGPNIFSPQIAIVPYIDFGSFQIGDQRGGTCYTATASSGCMTLQFISDFQGEREGFHGFWECTADPCFLPQPISVNTLVGNQTIIDNISTPQTTVSIDTIICDGSQYGVFEADNSDLGLDRGVILTTGYAFDAVGPNFLNDWTLDWGLPGDPDLDALDFPNITYDACVLELDVFVIDDELTFEYIFASEEYPEFINQSFNDVFSFFISGPGITGNPTIGNQENIALIPGTDTEVSINNINHTNNWEYFRYNGVIGDPSIKVGRSIEYDGMTSDFMGNKKSLTARKKVSPCNTYHLKLVVADKGDPFFDSAVFVSEVSGGAPSMDITFFNGVDFLVEDCTLFPDQISIELPLPDFEEPTVFMVDVGGTATRDDDYVLNMPSTITFQPGETKLSFPISALPDGIPEGKETIEIRLINDFGCGETLYATLTFEIDDNPDVEITPDQDTLYVCPGESIQFDVQGATQYKWSPTDIVDNSFIQNPMVTPTASTLLIVEGGIGVCEGVDSIWLEVVDPFLDIEVMGNTSLCEGESVTLVANNNAGNTNLVWTGAGLNATDTATVIAQPLFTNTYSAMVSYQSCFAFDTVTIFVEPYNFPEITTLDTTICPNDSFQLAENITGSTTTFSWSPSDGLSPGHNISGPVAKPLNTTVYTLTSLSENGVCSDTVSVNVEVLNFDPSLVVSESISICEREETVLTASTSSTAPQFEWLVDGNVVSQEATITVMPNQSTTYQVIATDDDNFCFIDQDSTTVTVIPAFVIDDLIAVDDDGNELGSDPDILSGQQISLEVNTTPLSLNNATFEWSVEGETPFLTTNTNSSGLFMAPIISQNSSIIYHVFITDENGCTDELTINVDMETVTVEVPTGFTPDGDGVNDLFRLVTPGEPMILQFKVYNRWGQVVYDEGQSWDGNYKGEPAPSDVYFYHIIYQLFAETEKVELKGDLTLIR